MAFTKITPYSQIEENITNGALLCEVENDTDVSYSLEADHPEYFSIDSESGRVRITGDGLEAVNKDYPEDISKEIQTLEFTITATNTTTGKKDRVNVKVPVSRVRDSEPYILSSYVYKLYTDDLYTGINSIAIRTTYSSIFEITGQLGLYFDITNGDFKLNNDGVLYFSKFDFDNLKDVENETIDGYEVKKIKVPLRITDKENDKFIEPVMNLRIYKGSKDKNLPTKNNAELTAEMLGQDLGKELSDIDKVLVANTFATAETDRKVKLLIEQLFNKLPIINGQSDINDYLKLSADSKIQDVDSKLNILIKSIKDDLSKDIFNVIKDYENTITEKIDNESENAGYARMIEHVYNIFPKYINFYSNYIKEFAIAYNNKNREFLLNVLENRVNILINSINNNIITPNNSRIQSLVNNINLKSTKIIELLNDRDDHEARLVVVEEKLADVRARVSTIEGLTLEDFGDSDHWDFNTDTLFLKTKKILQATEEETRVIATDVVILKNGTKVAKWEDQTLTIDGGSSGSKVVAETFEGTATTAKYADLAEYYLSDSDYIPGTVCAINTSSVPGASEITSYKKDLPLCGVVTTNPGFILNNERAADSGYVCIALVGKTPVFVQGSVKKGMYLYPSNENVGYAYGSFEKLDNCIGVALEDGIYSVMAKVK